MSLDKKYCRIREERTFFLSLLADQTTNVSTKEQLTICLRYVTDEGICKRFIGFREVSDLTGAGLANKLLATVTTAGILMSHMVGQGYDGAAALSGCENGVQKHIYDKCPTAMYVCCISMACRVSLQKRKN